MIEFVSTEHLFGELLKRLGEDTKRGGLRETPERATKAWKFFCQGYKQDPKDVLKTFEDGGETYDELLFQANIPIFSNCEHHLQTFFGAAHIAYVPNGRVVGLSKLSRLAEIFARRLQVQERLTQQIADALMEHLSPKGVGVVLQMRHMCYDDQTDVLTENGFKRFSEVSDHERVAQVDPRTGQISYVFPLSRVAAKYSGQMHFWKGKSYQQLVTPEHRCLVASEWKYKEYGQEAFEFKKASDLFGAAMFYIPRAGIYNPNGSADSSISFCGEQLSVKDACALLGIHMAEGWAGYDRSTPQVTICQAEKSVGFAQIRQLLFRIPFGFKPYLQKTSPTPDFWHFESKHKPLSLYLQQFGKSRDKYVPDFVFHAPKEARMEFLRFYMLGDGRWDPDNSQWYSGTLSKQLAHDLQRLWVTLGYGCRITNPIGKDTNGEQWHVRVHMRKGQPRADATVEREHRSTGDYEGMVHCLNVPSGALMIRRDGCVVVSGNCMEARGIQKVGTVTMTSCLRGCVKEEAECRSEFMSLVNTASQGLVKL